MILDSEWLGEAYKDCTRLNLAIHPKFIEQAVSNTIEEYKKLK